MKKFLWFAFAFLVTGAVGFGGGYYVRDMHASEAPVVETPDDTAVDADAGQPSEITRLKPEDGAATTSRTPPQTQAPRPSADRDNAAAGTERSGTATGAGDAPVNPRPGTRDQPTRTDTAPKKPESPAK